MFDKNHFILAIAATKRRATVGVYIVALRYVNGHLQVTAEDELLRKLFKPEEAKRLNQRLFDWASKLSLESVQ